nr:unknown [Aeromonas hydrophila]
MIYSDYSTHPREINQRVLDESQTIERLRSLRQVLYGDGPGDAKVFLQIVHSTHLFDGQIDIAEKFIAEAFS